MKNSIKILIFAALFLAPSVVFGAFPGDYSEYQEVTIQSSQVDADLTDFPIYVNLADLAKSGSDIFDTVRSDGGDIRVTKDDGTTQLPREVVSIDTTAETGELHIKYDGTLSSSTDTTIRIWYNGTDTEPASDSTYGSENVWSSVYEAVYHLETTGTIVDPTSNGNDSSSTESDQVSAKIGNGRSNDASKQDDFGDVLDGMTDLTLSMWANPDADDGGIGIAVSKYATNPNRSYYLGFFDDDSDNVREIIFFATEDGDSQNTSLRGTTSLSKDSWYHMVATLDGSAGDARTYVDGSADGTDLSSGCNSINNSSADFSLFTRESDDAEFVGDLDEVRVLNSVLSANWISTEYNNQSSPSTFYNTSDEISTGGVDVFVPARIIFSWF